MRQFINILEDFSSQPNRWVHYSNVPYIKINPKPFHQDPMAIYCFPENFNAIGQWTKYRYKFTVSLKPSANVLDFAHITDEELYAMIDAAGIRKGFEAHIEKYPPENMNRKMDMAWESLVRYYAFENGEGKRLAQFNKILRTLGYDCIFDDGKIVHIAEEQLIVLNPRCINIIDMSERSERRGSGFKAMKKVMDDLTSVCKPYGEIEITEPKVVKSRYSDNRVLQAQVKVSRSEDNFISFEITATGDGGYTSEVPTQIHISAGYSRPRLNSSYASRYKIMAGKYDDYFGDGLADIRHALQKTFPE